MPSAWTRLRAAVDPIVRPYHLYTAYPLDAAEHVGTVADMDTEAARWYLTDKGYAPQYLSAAKRHPDTDQLHDLSYRRVPEEHPFGMLKPDIDAPAIQSIDTRRCQLHVHVFITDAGAWFGSHYELRPDLRPVAGESVAECVERLRTHYRPEYGDTYLQGVTDLEL